MISEKYERAMNRLSESCEERIEKIHSKYVAVKIENAQMKWKIDQFILKESGNKMEIVSKNQTHL